MPCVMAAASVDGARQALKQVQNALNDDRNPEPFARAERVDGGRQIRVRLCGNQGGVLQNQIRLLRDVDQARVCQRHRQQGVFPN